MELSTLYRGGAVLSVLTLIYVVVRAIYFAYLHPLAKIPGPKFYATSDLVFLYHLIRGEWPQVLKRLHDQYGPVVRFGPNDVSFTTPDAWKTIYGHKTQLSRNFEKDTQFFNPPVDGVPGILIADHDGHKRMRRILAHAFSEKALRGQEDIIKQYVDLLLLRMSERAGTVVNMVQWYNFTTFDLIGDLAFGRPLGLLESGQTNPWVTMIMDNVKMTTYTQIMARYPAFALLVPALVPSKVRSGAAAHFQLSRRTALERARSGAEREDFMTYMLKHNDEKGMSEDEIVENSSALIGAGSETTATLLSGLTYRLLTNRDKYDRLVAEIRGAFNSEDEITTVAVNNLTYLGAVINESFRMYPPVPSGLPRFAPSGGEVVSGYEIPENTSVSVAQWASYQCEQNWLMPQRFLPERWLGEPRFDNDKRDVLQPFSTGPRNCIGKNLAYLELRMIVTRLLYNFDIEMMPESREWPEQRIFTLWEKKELLCKLYPRVHEKKQQVMA